MKKILLPLTLLAFAAACGDSSLTNPTPTVGPEIPKPTFDDIANDLDTDIDAVAEVMPLNVGTNGTTELYLEPTNGDGKSGCNLTGSTTLTVSISSSNTAAATVSPSTFVFNSCGAKATLTVTPVAQGTATISLTETGNTTDQTTFNLSPATFTVNVSAPPPANTAPTIAVAGVTAGASYNKGSVPLAMCQVTDTEDGNSSFVATLSPITGPYASDGIGSQEASCTYEDGGGLTVSASKTYGIVDPSAPTIGYALTPDSPDGTNGWYKSDVTLTWTVDDPESPNSLSKTGAKTGCVDQKIEADQTEQTYTCSATSAGGTTGPQSVSIKRDATAPSVPQADVINTIWRNTDLSQAFTASDVTSGLDVATDASFTLTASDESADANTPTTASKTVTDKAGNSTTRTVSALIDKTAPTNVSFVGGPANNSVYIFGDIIPGAPTCSANDVLSGLDNCIVTGYTTLVGSHTLTATATDNAGNTNTATTTYTVLAWTTKGFYQPTDMGDVLNTVKGGSTVPLKFEVFAGDRELTDVSAIGSSYKTLVISCTVGTPQDDIEVVSTGGTTLRYDTTAGQFIQNWQTPKQVGACYKVTVALADGSKISALFKLK